MVQLIQSKQVSKLVASRVTVAGYNYTAGVGVTSFDGTVDMTTALATAGNGGIPVPVQQYIQGTQSGVITAGRNIVEIYDSVTGLKMYADTAAGEEIYGRVTFAAGVYTIGLFTMIAGVETAYEFLTNQVIDYVFPYVFTFATLPEDALLGIKSTYVNDDPTSGLSDPRTYTEILPVTGLNAIAGGITFPYTTGVAWMSVNGQWLSTLDGSFTLAAGLQTVVWNNAIAGYNLDTTDVVTIKYPY